MVFDHVGPALWARVDVRPQARGPPRELWQHDRRHGDDPVARPAVPQRARRSSASTPTGPTSSRWPGRSTSSGGFHSPIDSVFPLSAGRRGAAEAAAPTTSSARSSSTSPRDAEPPEWPTRRTRSSKKSHTMAHAGRPWRDYKPPPSAPVWALIQGFGSYWALVAAIELGVFDALEDCAVVGRPRSPTRAARRRPHLEHLLDALVDVRLPRPGRRGVRADRDRRALPVHGRRGVDGVAGRGRPGPARELDRASPTRSAVAGSRADRATTRPRSTARS